MSKKSFNHIKDHFKRVDPLLFTLSETIGIIPVTASNDYFIQLTDAIISQQLSEKAGATIFSRFTALFKNDGITPEGVIALSDEVLRSCGMSGSKVKFIKDLAHKVVDKEVELEKFALMENEAIITELTRVKGIGSWTAEMFLMSSLGREDVFSVKDLGLKRAIQKLYGLDYEPKAEELAEIASKWSPYRTYACRILWKSLSL